MNSDGNQGDLEPANRNHARTYVFIQAAILFLLIFFSNKVGYQVSKVERIGTFLEFMGFLGFLLTANILRSTLTAIPIPKPDGKLSTDGLYKYARHPMYSSVLVLSLGIALRSGSLFKYFLLVGLAILFYFKSAYEEKYLLRKYPEYATYVKTVPRFIPFT